MPIGFFTGHAEEQRPGPNFSAVISKSPNLDGGIPNDPGSRKLRGQRIQSHGPDSKKGVG